MNSRDNKTPRCVMRRTLLSVALAVCMGAGVGHAQPIGPQVIHGSASFVAQGNAFTVTNSPNAIINWQGFSIAPHEVMRFVQQSGNSAVLNRVVGQEASAILGILQSNGRVWIINPNGILFGPDARVDVNGLIASTLDIANQDFLAGRYRFSAGNLAGKLENQGAITTPGGGQIALIAPNLENSGIITSPQGAILLAAGHSVQLVDTANPDLAVVVSAPEDRVLNLGQILSQGGKVGVASALVNQRGTVSADSAVVGENGKIVFKASKDTLLEAGSVTSATGAGRGGDIQVLGERVGLAGNARLDASGQEGGGTVLVGGDYQGRNTQIQNARITYVGPEASIKADAGQQGDGGRVIVWADDTTRYFGAISARGGATQGNGGFAEVSGKRSLAYRGGVDLRAPYGLKGTLLLDPRNITIQASGVGVIANNDTFAENSGSDVTIDPGNVVTALDGANLVLQANNDIIVDTASAIDASSNTGNGNLTLQAGRSVVINSAVTTKGALTVIANEKLAQGVVDAQRDVGDAVISTTAALGSSGNAITLTLEDGAGKTYSESGNISIGGAISSLGGNVTITTKQVSNGGDIVITSSGSINANDASAGTVLLAAAKGITSSGSISSVGSTDGDITIKAAGGNIVLNDDAADINAGTAGRVELDASGGIQGAQYAIVFADELLFKSGGLINGTGSWPFSTSVNKMDVTSGTGIVNIFNADGKALTLMDLETDTGALGYGYAVKLPAHGSVSTINVTNANMTVSSPIHVTGTGDFELRLTSAGNAVTHNMTISSDITQAGVGGRVRLWSDPTLWGGAGSTPAYGPTLLISGNTVGAPDGSVLLDFYTISQSGVVSAKAVQYTTQSLDVSGTTTATGTTSPLSGIRITPFTTNSSFLVESGELFDPAQLSQFTSQYVEFAGNGTGNISINSAVASSGSVKNLALVASAGEVNQTAEISLPTCTDCGGLKIVGGSGNVTLENTSNSVDYFTASMGAGNLSFTNSKTLNVKEIKSVSSDVLISTQAGNINVLSPGIDGCYGMTSDCSSAVTLSAYGSISAPLVRATSVNLYATTGNVVDADGSLNNIVSGNDGGSVNLHYEVAGSISLDAWGATVVDSGTPNFTPSSAGSTVDVRLTQPASGGGSAPPPPPPPPTIDQCAVNPSLSGCSTVLPPLDTCLANPTAAGCSVVLPPLNTCVANPTAAGCSVVLPPLDTCVANPTAAGCSVVLPPLNTCVANPTAAGCSVVLPPLDTCVTNPTAAGCSVVLPPLNTCVTNPTAAGCSVVLPPLNTCVANPTAVGCGAVLPTLDQCAANPGALGCAAVLPPLSSCVTNPMAAGCGAVLPSLNACVSNPSAAGCSAVLPPLNDCVANPAAPGCSAVLPPLATCTANPSAPGCAAVLPPVSDCVANPSAPGCTVVLPPLNTCAANPSAPGCTVVLPAQLPEVIRVIETTEDVRPLQQTLNQSSNNLNSASMVSVVRPVSTVTLLNTTSANAPRASTPSSGGGGEGGAAQGPAPSSGTAANSGTGEGSGRSAGSEKKDDKKDDKKKDVVAQKEDKKDEAPKNKQFCN